MATIKDSGTRRKFETGAVRDMQEGKGRMDLLPWCAVLRVARHFEAGAVKYGDRNWERGIPLSSFLDSAFRHLAKYMDGLDDEDHLCAAAWNLLCALWTEEKRPDLINIPTRPEYAGGAQYGLENEDEMVEQSSSSLTIKEDGIEIRNGNGDMVAKLDSTNGGWPQVFEIDDQEPEKLKKPDWPKDNPFLAKKVNLPYVFPEQLQQKATEHLQKLDLPPVGIEIEAADLELLDEVAATAALSGVASPGELKDAILQLAARLKDK